MIRDYQAIQKTWFLKGKQRIIPNYGKHQGVKLIGTLNYETGEIFCVEEEKYDAPIFLAFLEKILAHYPSGKILLILDNVRIHHAKLIQPFLEKNRQRIQLVFFPNSQKIKLHVREFIRLQNTRKDHIIDRLCLKL